MTKEEIIALMDLSAEKIKLNIEECVDDPSGSDFFFAVNFTSDLRSIWMETAANNLAFAAKYSDDYLLGAFDMLMRISLKIAEVDFSSLQEENQQEPH